MMVGGEMMEVKERPRPSPDYLMQLLNEKKLMTSLPNLCGIFTHLERLLDEGLTTKQLEAETGCKIMVRGKSSMRDKKKEEQNRGKPNWEHLNEDLHVR
ncbi:hypothetical protein CRUP_036644, partial [Coryphaenoides rupestris]